MEENRKTTAISETLEVWDQIAKETRSPIFSVTVLDAYETELGAVHLCAEEPLFLHHRVEAFLDSLDNVKETAMAEWQPIEGLDDRQAKWKQYDETLMENFQNLFPTDSITGLFKNHNPTDTVNGRAYVQELALSILCGFHTAITECIDEGSDRSPRLYNAFAFVAA